MLPIMGMVTGWRMILRTALVLSIFNSSHAVSCDIFRKSSKSPTANLFVFGSKEFDLAAVYRWVDQRIDLIERTQKVSWQFRESVYQKLGIIFGDGTKDCLREGQSVRSYIESLLNRALTDDWRRRNNAGRERLLPIDELENMPSRPSEGPNLPIYRELDDIFSKAVEDYLNTMPLFGLRHQDEIKNKNEELVVAFRAKLEFDLGLTTEPMKFNQMQDLTGFSVGFLHRKYQNFLTHIEAKLLASGYSLNDLEVERDPILNLDEVPTRGRRIRRSTNAR